MSMIDVRPVKTEMTRRHSATLNCLDVAGWNSLKVRIAMDKPLIKAEIMLNVLLKGSRRENISETS